MNEYVERFAQSQRLHARATALAASIAHDSWSADPFPVYFTHGEGPYKWDVDGHRFIDFWMGHGALLCGYRHAPVEAAVARQLTCGTHLGGAHPLQLEWAERVIGLIPSAEAVRFVSSGSEATLLALRVARAFTGRRGVVRIAGHFHGWHDEALAHAADPSGINPGTAEHVVVVENDVDAIAAALSKNDVAALMLEPGGGGSGTLAWSAAFLAELRRLCDTHGTLLIFDEVVSAFRYAPGGVQQLSGVTPDLTVLAKVLAGGLPGGAVAGRRDVMSVFTRGARRDGRPAHVRHTGTFNANPLAAAAGIAMLDSVADGAAQAAAERAATRLVNAVNAAAIARGADIRLYNQSSIIHIVAGGAAVGIEPVASPRILALQKNSRAPFEDFRRALLLEGVDINPFHGWISSTHTDEVIDEATAAFERAMARV